MFDPILNYRSNVFQSFKGSEEQPATEWPVAQLSQIVDLAGRENEQTSECKDERFRELRHDGGNILNCPVTVGYTVYEKKNIL